MPPPHTYHDVVEAYVRIGLRVRVRVRVRVRPSSQGRRTARLWLGLHRVRVRVKVRATGRGRHRIIRVTSAGSRGRYSQIPPVLAIWVGVGSSGEGVINSNRALLPLPLTLTLQSPSSRPWSTTPPYPRS